MKTFLILSFFLPHVFYCQDTIHIAFNSKLNFEAKDINYSFHFMENGKEKNIVNLDINEYVFNTPGIYRVETKKLNQKPKYFSRLINQCNNDKCVDFVLPDLFYVQVDSLIFVYNPESIYITKPICINKSCEGNSMYIELDVYNFYNTPILMPLSPVTSDGIGTEIKAILDPAFKKLLPGKHRIKYNLTGFATLSSYIQFNFNNIGGFTPIGLKEKLLKCTE